MMSRLTRAIALLLLALWVPVTAHCRLESIPVFSFLVCCGHDDAVPHQDSDCEEDACGTVESGAYRIAQNAPWLLGLAPIICCVLTEVPVAPEPPHMTAAALPPELPVSWQFSFRTALPPRAPSFVS
ncbi:MAG: hypothetical protein HY674_09710 [Chloroflexi bacterium]|nr:hypothetical protein [Chloroflexota bacterium]